MISTEKYNEFKICNKSSHRTKELTCLKIYVSICRENARACVFLYVCVTARMLRASDILLYFTWENIICRLERE